MLKKIIAGLCFFLPSKPTCFLFRLCGHRVGKNVRIPVFTFICAESLTIGNDVDIRRFVFIYVRKLSLGANTIVSYGCQIKGEAGFSCGDNCIFGVSCLIHCAEDVTVGFYSGLGPRCTVYTHGSFLPVTMGYPAKFAPVIIEDYVWIAMEVTIMPGVHIGRNCLVSPGVVLDGRVRSDSIVQIDSKNYQIFDFARLQKIGKKDTSYWHGKIITEFLDAQSLSYQFNRQANEYVAPGGYTFVSHPDTNSIELIVSGRRIQYDLEGFHADYSKKNVHREFLKFIRLHHGIILRTRYK